MFIENHDIEQFNILHVKEGPAIDPSEGLDPADPRRKAILPLENKFLS